ncbi:MAG: hypothetical protein RR620_10905 [Clostridium sp.]
MSETQKMLDQAIEWFGFGDIITIMLSQRRDKEILKQQRRVGHA